MTVNSITSAPSSLYLTNTTPLNIPVYSSWHLQDFRFALQASLHPNPCISNALHWSIIFCSILLHNNQFICFSSIFSLGHVIQINCILSQFDLYSLFLLILVPFCLCHKTNRPMPWQLWHQIHYYCWKEDEGRGGKQGEADGAIKEGDWRNLREIIIRRRHSLYNMFHTHCNIWQHKVIWEGHKIVTVKEIYKSRNLK